MNIKLEVAVEKDAELILDIQVRAFLPLLEKYQDFETNPANETIERVVKRIINPQGQVYKIIADGVLVGAICVVRKEDGVMFWIGPMFILPEEQGKGVAQKAVTLLMEMFPEVNSWGLATLLEEERNCYLYEKMGFTKTGDQKALNDKATLVFYNRIC
ncbi:RimJ/RimL family protein N-acetyltransferase [Paenibacillus sp. BK033]|uniref:GNAT family N-acetyltransferase n=1 Tax=Paenibacillus sp. BK033 TaxID=2512133 RepID=UPI001046D8C2|nr:GNAT family N-acetyltransferase [Paenibacillus sp. BK033]TCM89720.1 RimJ/RimL family protein N-acetyltransferase [Paenibacillus sp. BK033]